MKHTKTEYLMQSSRVIRDGYHAPVFPSVLLSRLVSFLRRQPPRMRGLRGVGQEWERLAEKHLKEAGYKIRERNFRTRVGEIDFVAQDGDVLCFVEVKGRHGTGSACPRRRSTPRSSAGSFG